MHREIVYPTHQLGKLIVKARTAELQQAKYKERKTIARERKGALNLPSHLTLQNNDICRTVLEFLISLRAMKLIQI